MNHKLNLKIISILLFVAFIILSCQTSSNSDKDESVICSSQETPEYVLPYPVGTTYTCIQGYVGRTYHKGVFKYGLDFSMSIGSIVTCARSGRVVFVEESFSDEDYGIEKANLVVVLHTDSTYGRYVHLTKNGALVNLNQTVAQCDTIGLSGSSGYSPKPHLHFDVTKDCPQSNCQTIPICFKNTKNHPYGLVTGESYTANIGVSEHLISDHTEHMIPEMVEHTKPERKHNNIKTKRLYDLITNRLLTLNRNRVLTSTGFSTQIHASSSSGI